MRRLAWSGAETARRPPAATDAPCPEMDGATTSDHPSQSASPRSLRADRQTAQTDAGAPRTIRSTVPRPAGLTLRWRAPPAARPVSTRTANRRRRSWSPPDRCCTMRRRPVDALGRCSMSCAVVANGADGRERHSPRVCIGMVGQALHDPHQCHDVVHARRHRQTTISLNAAASRSRPARAAS